MTRWPRDSNTYEKTFNDSVFELSSLRLATNNFITRETIPRNLFSSIESEIGFGKANSSLRTFSTFNQGTNHSL